LLTISMKLYTLKIDKTNEKLQKLMHKIVSIRIKICSLWI
jgi:hypothetical protein